MDVSCKNCYLLLSILFTSTSIRLHGELEAISSIGLDRAGDNKKSLLQEQESESKIFDAPLSNVFKKIHMKRINQRSGVLRLPYLLIAGEGGISLGRPSGSGPRYVAGTKSFYRSGFMVLSILCGLLSKQTRFNRRGGERSAAYWRAHNV